MTTPRSSSGLGPKKEVNAPGVVVTEASSTRASASMAAMKPPFSLSTASTTTTMPPSMMRPWMKSLMAVAM